MFIVNAWIWHIKRDFHAFDGFYVNVIHWFFGVFAAWYGGCFSGLVMSETTSIETTTTATTNPLAADLAAAKAMGLLTVKPSTGSAKSQLDSAISILSVLSEIETADYWRSNRQQVLSAFGSVRTKSADGDATSRGVDFGSASLSKVLKHLSSPKREAALLSAAWAMASAIALKWSDRHVRLWSHVQSLKAYFLPLFT